MAGSSTSGSRPRASRSSVAVTCERLAGPDEVERTAGRLARPTRPSSPIAGRPPRRTTRAPERPDPVTQRSAPDPPPPPLRPARRGHGARRHRLRQRWPSPPTRPVLGDRWDSVARPGRSLPGRPGPGPPDRGHGPGDRAAARRPTPTPTAEPTPRPTLDRSRGASDPPDLDPAPTPTPTPEPVREAIDVDLLDDPDDFFASQVHKDWCAVGRRPRWSSPSTARATWRDPSSARSAAGSASGSRKTDSRNGNWGPAAMALALDAYGVPGLRGPRLRVAPGRPARRGPQHPVDRRAGHPAGLARRPHLGDDRVPGRRRPDRLPRCPHRRAPTSWTRGTRACRRSGARSDPPGTFQNGPEMERNFLKWRRPEGRYPDRDGLYITVAPTVPLEPGRRADAARARPACAGARQTSTTASSDAAHGDPQGVAGRDGQHVEGRDEGQGRRDGDGEPDERGHDLQDACGGSRRWPG